MADNIQSMAIEEVRAALGGAVSDDRDDLRTRLLLRRWLALKGIPLDKIERMQFSTMQKCYNIKPYMEKVVRSFVRDAKRADGTYVPRNKRLRDDNDDDEAEEVPSLADWGRIRGYIDEASTINANRNEVKIQSMVQEALEKMKLPRPPVVIEIKEPGKKAVKLAGHHHKQFEDLLKACGARSADGMRLNIMLVGPAGSGKTTAAENVAKAFKIPFYFNGAIDTEYKLVGFTDAHGKTVRRPFREAFGKPSVYLFDEIDGSHPNGCLPLNAALSNGAVDFPDAIEKRHKDCIIIAAANTFGLGGTSDYVGRNKLDAAFIDRFVVLKWLVDEELELATAPDTDWCRYVQHVRRRAALAGLKVIISPRASYYGAALLEQGMSRPLVADMVLRKGMSDEQWGNVQ